MEKFTGKVAIGDDENKSQTSITQTSLTKKSAIKSTSKGAEAEAIQKKAQQLYETQPLGKNLKEQLSKKLSLQPEG